MGEKETLNPDCLWSKKVSTKKKSWKLASSDVFPWNNALININKCDRDKYQWSQIHKSQWGLSLMRASYSMSLLIKLLDRAEL